MTIKHTFQRQFALIMAALCMVLAAPAQALSLAVENGEITGILDIEIKGQRYDITFVDGAFNAIYPVQFSGYGQLAQDAALALLAASDNGTLQAAANWRADLMLHGCSGTACTLLIPEQADGAAPAAHMINAREVIESERLFRSVPAKLWPFAASADTQQMPDMLYAIITPAR